MKAILSLLIIMASLSVQATPATSGSHPLRFWEMFTQYDLTTKDVLEKEQTEECLSMETINSPIPSIIPIGLLILYIILIQ